MVGWHSRTVLLFFYRVASKPAARFYALDFHIVHVVPAIREGGPRVNGICGPFWHECCKKKRKNVTPEDGVPNSKLLTALAAWAVEKEVEASTNQPAAVDPEVMQGGIKRRLLGSEKGEDDEN